MIKRSLSSVRRAVLMTVLYFSETALAGAAFWPSSGHWGDSAVGRVLTRVAPAFGLGGSTPPPALAVTATGRGGRLRITVRGLWVPLERGGAGAGRLQHHRLRAQRAERHLQPAADGARDDRGAVGRGYSDGCGVAGATIDGAPVTRSRIVSMTT